MIYAEQQPDTIAGDAVNLFKFQMITTVGHEMTHCLTGYLTGTSRPPTPTTVSLTGFSNGRAGEAGRFWEGTLLGGVVEFYEYPEDPLGARQAGVPYLIKDGKSKSTARQISLTYILDFLAGSELCCVMFGNHPIIGETGM